MTGVSCTSSTRISIAMRSKRAIAPRALTHSLRKTPSGSCGAKIAIDRLEQPLVILADRAHRLRHDVARDRRDARAIAAIDDEPIVEHAVALAVDDRRARGEPRQDRQQEADRGVQPRELLVARERQVDLQALQIRPAVAFAREDAVERVVDVARAVRPELRRRSGPSTGASPSASSRNPSRPSLSFASLTLSAKARPRPASDGRGPLHLNSMTCSASSLFHATSPFSNSSVSSPAAASSSSSAAGATSRRLAVDEHVLDLEAERLEQAQRLARAGGVVRRRV